MGGAKHQTPTSRQIKRVLARSIPRERMWITSKQFGNARSGLQFLETSHQLAGTDCTEFPCGNSLLFA